LPKIATIEIYDISGTLILKTETEGPVWKWVNNLSSGIYIVVIKTTSEKKIGRLVIIK
jgi:hypothetical protein